jgi:hypothetical protein
MTGRARRAACSEWDRASVGVRSRGLESHRAVNRLRKHIYLNVAVAVHHHRIHGVFVACRPAGWGWIEKGWEPPVVYFSKEKRTLLGLSSLPSAPRATTGGDRDGPFFFLGQQSVHGGSETDLLCRFRVIPGHATWLSSKRQAYFSVPAQRSRRRRSLHGLICMVVGWKKTAQTSTPQCSQLRGGVLWAAVGTAGSIL